MVQRRARRAGQAGRPAAQHAHARISRAAEAAAHLARNAGHLCAHRAPPGNGHHPQRTGGSFFPLSGAGIVSRAAKRSAATRRRSTRNFWKKCRQRFGRSWSRAAFRRSWKRASRDLYSLHRKIVRQERSLEQVYDLLAVRVITDNERNCYAALGVMHHIWRPVPGRFKDYIAMPRPNLYQSLHTTVLHGGPAVRSADSHAGNAPHRGRRRGGALEIQGRQAGSAKTTSASPGCGS